MHDLGTSSLAELFEIGSVGSDLTVAASAESPTIENNNTNDTTVSGSATIFNSNPNLNILSSTAVTVNYSQNNILNAPAPEPLVRDARVALDISIDENSPECNPENDCCR